MTERIELVDCPTCRGTGHSPFVPTNICGCCNGNGTITTEKLAILQMIQKDLRERYGI